LYVSMQGLESQNRSVEGDEVALRILPPCGWWVFKREQLKAAQKAAAKGPSREAQGVDLAGSPNAAISEVATPAGILPWRLVSMHFCTAQVTNRAPCRCASCLTFAWQTKRVIACSLISTCTESDIMWIGEHATLHWLCKYMLCNEVVVTGLENPLADALGIFVAALSMENAVSGGKIPYQFADTDGETACLAFCYIILQAVCLCRLMAPHTHEWTHA